MSDVVLIPLAPLGTLKLPREVFEQYLERPADVSAQPPLHAICTESLATVRNALGFTVKRRICNQMVASSAPEFRDRSRLREFFATVRGARLSQSPMRRQNIAAIELPRRCSRGAR